jgi:hypothetical protein
MDDNNENAHIIKRLEWDIKGDNKIVRKFTGIWKRSGMFNMDTLPKLVELIVKDEYPHGSIINKDRVPDLVKSLVVQQQSMIEYIELLHDKMDDVFEKNNICNCTTCHRANCTSDHQ